MTSTETLHRDRLDALRTLDRELSRIFGPLAEWDLETLDNVDKAQQARDTQVVRVLAWLLSQCERRKDL